MSETTKVRAVCPHDCPDTCSMVVTVRDGRAVAVRGDAEHPFTRASSVRRSPATSTASTTRIACCGP